ncbi:glycoside hydrolase family 19 protein [Nocardia mikamii]|uniref:glycoside hydrolase family 19 protein n=1 Tax=Nocardia mikamii TaxID=508464 RepID=UPI0007A410D2|nr:glycoside hydrolase family 19 protein [Nocardia mikamii]
MTAKAAATSPQAAAPDDATTCPTYGWTGWTVELPPPPQARQALKQTTGMVQAVFQAMVDHLGVGDKAAVPDVNRLLTDAGLADTIDHSTVTSAHNATVDKLRGVTQGLVSRHADIAAEVASAARMGTELNRDIWDEVGELRSALHAAGPGKLSAGVEIGLIERLRTSLREVWKKYERVAGANKASADAMGPLTFAEMKTLAPKANSDTLRKYLPYLNKAMLAAGITTPEREAAFLAQVLHETDQLKTLTEYGDRNYFDSNYGPQTAVGRSLGNTQPGDGARYRGRGALQITGRSNYAAAGKAIGVDLVHHPERADDPEHAFDIAAWFWRSHHLNDAADADDLNAVTRTINGGDNGAAARRKYYDKARDVLDAD